MSKEQNLVEEILKKDNLTKEQKVEMIQRVYASYEKELEKDLKKVLAKEMKKI